MHACVQMRGMVPVVHSHHEPRQQCNVHIIMIIMMVCTVFGEAETCYAGP